MKKTRFIIKELAGDFFYSPNEKPNGYIVFLNGFPSFIGANPITEVSVKNNLFAIQPHFYGTYDSKRVFSPKTFADTFKTLNESFKEGYLTDAKDDSKIKLINTPRICIAHSFGCYVALRGLNYWEGVENLILMAPALHYGKTPVNYGLKEDGLNHFDYVKKAWPNTYNLGDKSDWEEYLLGNDILPQNDRHKTLKKVVVVVGNNDKYFDINSLEMNHEKILRAYFGNSVSIEFIKIPNKGHYIDDLVYNNSNFNIINYLI